MNDETKTVSEVIDEALAGVVQHARELAGVGAAMKGRCPGVVNERIDRVAKSLEEYQAALDADIDIRLTHGFTASTLARRVRAFSIVLLTRRHT